MTSRQVPVPQQRTEPVTIRLPVALWTRLQAAKERHGLSQTELVNRIIEAGLPMFEKGKTP